MFKNKTITPLLLLTILKVVDSPVSYFPCCLLLQTLIKYGKVLTIVVVVSISAAAF
jgi:hypothetical protein